MTTPDPVVHMAVGNNPNVTPTEDPTARTIRLVKQAGAIDERQRLLGVLKDLRDSLPTGHHELPGVIRAIEVLRYEGDGS